MFNSYQIISYGVRPSSGDLPVLPSQGESADRFVVSLMGSNPGTFCACCL